MAEEIGFENGMNSNFQGLVTLTLDPAIRHTIVHHSSTSTCIPNFIEIEETFCGRTDVRTDTYGRTFPPLLILLGRLLEVDLKTNHMANPRCASLHIFEDFRSSAGHVKKLVEEFDEILCS